MINIQSVSTVELKNPHHQKVYRALCQLLSGQAGTADWASFSGEDWQLLPEMARAEGVAPLLYSVLTQQAGGVAGDAIPIPQAAIQEVAQSYYHNAAFNAVLCGELDRALAALSRAGAPVVVLKGAALVKTLYADPAERKMSDLDVLVRRSNIRPAVRALQSAGFQHLMDNYIRYHVLMLGGQAGDVLLEVHWSLVYNDQHYPGLIDWFWRQTRPLDAENSQALTLSPTAHLLYLAAHLALQHGGERRLAWYYDLYLMMARWGGGWQNGFPRGEASDRIDWEELFEQAARTGWAQPLHEALSGVQARFGCALPDGFLQRLVERAAFESGQAGKLVGSTGERRSRGIAKTWRGLSLRDRVGVLRGLLLPRPAYLRWRYHPCPGWLWPLWYVRRWGDLMMDGVNAAG